MGQSGIRVRFAPSPTGHLHIGGARTALFNWLFARHHGGAYLLRIEDTDTERSTKESEENILDSFRWLGLTWDEQLVYQTQRLARHRAVAEELIAAGHAYRCYCSKEELDAMREAQTARGETARYDRRCRDKQGGDPSRPHVIRLAAPLEGEVVFTDRVLGDNRVAASELDDFVLVRTDGIPTYNFAVVVDDHDMSITHVIRGDGHLANTPKQILIYRALGWQAPEFAHLPLILGADKKPLSKRHGATSVIDYREQGFLPEALINYLARLGWAHGDQEIFTIDELIQHFDLDAVNKSPAVWDMEKLLWVNEQHMRRKTLGAEITSDQAEEFYQERKNKEGIDPLIHEIKAALKQRRLPPEPPAFSGATPNYWWPMVTTNSVVRSSTTAAATDCIAYLFFDTDSLYAAGDPNAREKFLRPDIRGALVALRDRISNLPEHPRETQLVPVIQSVVEEFGLKFGKLAQPVRVAMTGSSASMGIYAVLAAMTREQIVERLNRAIRFIDERA